MYVSSVEPSFVRPPAYLGQPVPPLADEKKEAGRLDQAIETELQRRFTSPTDPKLLERRRTLRQHFNAYPPSRAGALRNRLGARATANPLSRLFHHRLATATRQEMLGILDRQIAAHSDRLVAALIDALGRLSAAQLEPHAIDSLLVTGTDFEGVGLNIVQNEFPGALAEQVFESDPPLPRLLYQVLGEVVRRRADTRQRIDPAFKKKVDDTRQQREEERKKRERQPAPRFDDEVPT